MHWRKQRDCRLVYLINENYEIIYMSKKIFFFVDNIHENILRNVTTFVINSFIH